MIISVKENTVFGVFHPDAYDLFNTCSDLKKVAWELWDPHRRLNDEVCGVAYRCNTIADTYTQDKAVQLFRAFAPMLCKRPTKKLEDSVKEMQGRAFIIEEKLDGERMQLHKRGNEYFYCSRSVSMPSLSYDRERLTEKMLQERKRLHLSVWKARRYREFDSVHRCRF